MRIRQSLCLPCFVRPDLPLETLLPEVRRIGFRAVEIWDRAHVDFERIVALARDNDLAVATMCGHSSLDDGLNREQNHDRIEAELHASIELAAQHSIDGLICFSGKRNPGQSDQEGLETCARGLGRVAPYAEKHGVNLNVELLNSRVDHPGYQCDHSEWGVALCERVNSPRVKLLFDVYHMQIMEGDLVRSIRTHIRHIGHFHTAGNPGRHELDHTQELDYRGICRAIAQTNYDGYVAHEFFPTGDPLTALRSAFEICDQG